MTGPRDIHAYLAELEDIPGTRVFTAARAREGYHLNQFAMSLMKAENANAGKLASGPISTNGRLAKIRKTL